MAVKKSDRITRCGKDLLDEIEKNLVGKTQSDLASELGVHRITISDCRRGRSVSDDKQNDLRRRFGIPEVETELAEIDPRFERVTRKAGYGKHRKRTQKHWTRSVRLTEHQKNKIDEAVAASPYDSFSEWFLNEMYPRYIEETIT